jgi:hypothetical protein
MLSLPGKTYDRQATPIEAAPDYLRKLHIERLERQRRLGATSVQAWRLGGVFGPFATKQQLLGCVIARAARQHNLTLRPKGDPIALYRLFYERRSEPATYGLERARDIIRAVAAFHGLTVHEMLQDIRKQRIVSARQESMWLCARDTHLSYPAIARLHGGRDHTTVIAAIRKINRVRGENVRQLGEPRA